MSTRRRVLRAVYDRADFNALLMRLPRTTRRSIEPAPAGHVGLVVQIVSSDDSPLVTIRAHRPADSDLTVQLDKLEEQARAHLS